MSDPFIESPDDESIHQVGEELASTAEDSPVPRKVRDSLAGLHVCPFCGQQSEGDDACPRCAMEDTPATRQATKARIGPWYIMQTRNPAAPGMKYATLLALIAKGIVTPKSIVRGPTTHQLWRFAAHVRGVSREFGVCYSCGREVDKLEPKCGHCHRSQDAPSDPDVLVEIRPVGQAAIANANANVPQLESSSTYAARVRELNRRRAIGDQSRPPAEADRGALEPVIDGNRSDSSRAIAPRARQEMAPRGNGRVVSAMELAAALQGDANRAVLWQRRRAFKVAAALILLLCGAVVALYYLKPEYREPTFAWINENWSLLKSKVSSLELPTGPAPAPHPSKSAPAYSSVETPVGSDVLGSPAIPPPAVSRLQTGDNPAPSGTIATAENPPHASDNPVRSEPVARREQIPDIQPAPKPVQTDIAASPGRIDPIDALELARTLWIKAIDAEARQDFSSASDLYEQIKRLPNDAWPAGLQLRLEMAQKRLGQTDAR
jgi:hypothetical protein